MLKLKRSNAKFKHLAENRDSPIRTLEPASEKKAGRISIQGRSCWHFSSNDYLGLSESSQLQEAVIQATQTWGVGSTGSRLLGGDYTVFHHLEKEIATYKHKPAALLFNSGYQLNSGLIRCLVGPEDVVFADKLSHASLLDGVALSKATLHRFAHNDMAHLALLLKKYRHLYKQALIITESVFSMDGDIADIPALIALKKQHQAQLFVDEAHALGTMGHHGEGLIDSRELAQDVDYIVGTFGKSFGSFGAFVACSEQVKQHLIDTCRSFIFSTALPPSIGEASLTALGLIREGTYHVDLQKKVSLFRYAVASMNPLGSTHIVPILYHDAETTRLAANILQEKGYYIRPINPPTVPKGQSRLRISITLSHPDDVLIGLAKELKAIS